MNWYIGVLKKYAVFTGRARRSEYWYFTLFSLIIFIVLDIIDIVAHIYSRNLGIGLLGGTYELATLIPSIAVGSRRLHDMGRSGWWQLILFVPLVGVLVLLIFLATDGQPGDNQYGSNPKMMAA